MEEGYLRILKETLAVSQRANKFMDKVKSIAS